MSHHVIDVDARQCLDELKERLDHDGRDMLAKVLAHTRYNCYDAGYQDGIACFAWWNNGEQCVGTTGKRLKQVASEFHAYHNYNPDCINICLPLSRLSPALGPESAGARKDGGH